MADMVYRGTREQLIERLRNIPGILTGRIPDPTGLVKNILESMGEALLSNIQGAYETKSQGGVDDMGIQWKPNAPSTLAQRRVDLSKKALARAKKDFPKLSANRKALIAINYHRLLKFYKYDKKRGRASASSRKYSQRLLELIKPAIGPKKYSKLKTLLNVKKKKYEKQVSNIEDEAYLRAFGLILRDTGRLLNSLSPLIHSSDQIFRVTKGAISVGSNVMTKNGKYNLLTLHNSSGPRRKNKDGTDRLPRRQVLPDEQKPMPQAWKDDCSEALGNGIKSQAFIRRLLKS